MTRIRLCFTGSIDDLDESRRQQLRQRIGPSDEAVQLTVSAILEAVQREGDRALRSLAREFNHVALGALEVTADERARALSELDHDLRSALERSARNLDAVLAAGRPASVEVETEPGVFVGRRPDPLESVGVYVAGARVPSVSAVLMGAVPARVAGVPEIILCSPPSAKGRVPDVVLAAAELGGVTRVFALGGAGAIAAMAFGTESVPRVDRIVGQGDRYVTEAKLQAARVTGIDVHAGPPELFVIADDAADLKAVAREMLALAETDPQATVVAIMVGGGADTLITALSDTVGACARRTTIRESLANQGGVLSAASLRDAVAFASDCAPARLLLAVAAPEVLLPLVRNAGVVSLGVESSPAVGTYLTGAGNVVPTGGLAASQSALSIESFYRWTTWERVDRDAARRLAVDAALLATTEGLDAHARAAGARSVSR